MPSTQAPVAVVSAFDNAKFLTLPLKFTSADNPFQLDYQEIVQDRRAVEDYLRDSDLTGLEPVLATPHFWFNPMVEPNMNFDVAVYTRDLGRAWYYIMRAEELLAVDPNLLDIYCYIEELSATQRYIPGVLADPTIPDLSRAGD